MYYYKLLKTNQKGELVSPYGRNGDAEYIWKVGEWRKSDKLFYASESIVDALSVVWIGHFQVISLVEIRGDDTTKERLFTDIISKEMRIIKAWLWPKTLDKLIEKEVDFSGALEGFMIARSSEDFFKGLSSEVGIQDIQDVLYA